MERLTEMLEEVLSRQTGQEKVQQQLSEEVASKVRGVSSLPRKTCSFRAWHPSEDPSASCPSRGPPCPIPGQLAEGGHLSTAGPPGAGGSAEAAGGALGEQPEAAPEGLTGRG